MRMATSRMGHLGALLGIFLCCAFAILALVATGVLRTGLAAAAMPAASGSRLSTGVGWRDSASVTFQYSPNGPIHKTMDLAGDRPASVARSGSAAPSAPCPNQKQPNGPIHKTMGTLPGHCLQISGTGAGPGEMVTAALYDQYLRQITPLGSPVKADPSGAFVIPAVQLPGLQGMKMVYVQVTSTPAGSKTVNASLTILKQFIVSGP
jgi:hypothetical protein